VDRDDRIILISGALILVLLVVGYYFLLLSPLRQEYSARYDERTQKEAREAQLEQTVAELENVRRDAPSIERQILEYSKRLPSEDEIPTLVVQIEQIAEEANVTQLSIRPGSPEAPPGGGDFSRIPITMSFEGTYEELQDFLLRLRNLARLVTVNEVNYESAEKGGETTVNRGVENPLKVEISAETYVQPAAGEATTPAGGATTRAGSAGKTKGGKS
jgi:type IV pilus assembly protein PilO